NYAINDADMLLALGVRFDDRVTGKLSEFAKHGKIVHIDIDPSEINKNKVAHVPIVSDVGYALRELVTMLEVDREVRSVEHQEEDGGRSALRVPRSALYADWIRQIEEWREAEPFRYADRDDAIMPQYAIDRLWQIVRDRKQLDET